MTNEETLRAGAGNGARVDLTPGFPRGGLRPSLNELERLLTVDADPLPQVGRLADPFHLDLLFQVQLAALVRQGPGRAVRPRDLLALAQKAAAAGVLPASAPATLRRTLRKLEASLHDAGAWDRARPLWWSPVPPSTPLEDLWDGFGPDDGSLVLPSSDELSSALGDTPGAALRLSLPALLKPALIRSIWRGLEAAHREDHLDLERGGVGASDQRTARRSDQVRYLSGREPELLAAVPSLAAFIQWGLRHLARVLAAEGRPVHPPRRAMLARYPAPSGGYAPHLDNPGGEHDNGRTLTLVVYLNAPGHECAGGEIALWGKGRSTEGPPAAVLPPRSGSAALFDSRAIAHQVLPLREGPARWALTFWFSDAAQQPEPFLPRPRLELTDVLLPVPAPPLPADTVLFHELNDVKPTGEIVVRSTRTAKPRTGIVGTVYREGERLDAWCEHHFALGADHLVLVFDHLEEPEEQADAERLRARYEEERLTIWSGTGTKERWGLLAGEPCLAELPRFARLGSASYAIASRQTLNASVALKVAAGDELGGAPLDWLLHLDADERFCLEGNGRGGATLGEHFAAADAAGLELLRYVNHEVLLPCPAGSVPRFKVNPRLAAARLGAAGWEAMVSHLEMAQTDPRPYFNGYFNGKSAVRVRAGAAAAGVHGWFLSDPQDGRTTRFLAGPSVLHLHFSTPEAFRRKYLAIAASPLPPGRGLFELSPSEETTVGFIHQLEAEGADPHTVHRRLDELHETMTSFSEDEVEMLEEAGLLLRAGLVGRGCS